MLLYVLLTLLTSTLVESGCTPQINFKFACGTLPYIFTCESQVNGDRVSSIIRNPGGGPFSNQITSICHGPNHQVSSLTMHDTQTAGSQGHYVHNGQDSFVYNSYDAEFSWVGFNPPDVVCQVFVCDAPYILYNDIWFNSAATALPANPNPSGVTTCAPSNLGPASNGFMPFFGSGVQWCAEAGGSRINVATALYSGATITTTVHNPVGHLINFSLMDGTTCLSYSYGNLPSGCTVLSSTDGVTGTQYTLSGTCSTAECGFLLICGNNPAYDGVCGTITLDYQIINGQPPSNTPAGTPSGTPAGTPAGTPPGTSSSTAAGTPAETSTPASTPAPTTTPAGTPAETPTPAGTPLETSTPAVTPSSAVTLTGTPTRTPHRTPSPLVAVLDATSALGSVTITGLDPAMVTTLLLDTPSQLASAVGAAMQPGFPKGQSFDVTVQTVVGAGGSLVVTLAVTAYQSNVGEFKGTSPTTTTPVTTGAALSSLLTTSNNVVFSNALWATPLFVSAAIAASVPLIAPDAYMTSSQSTANVDPLAAASTGTSDGTSTSTIIGAAVGGGCGLLLIICVTYFCCARAKANKAKAASMSSSPPPSEEGGDPAEKGFANNSGATAVPAPRRTSLVRIERASSREFPEDVSRVGFWCFTSARGASCRGSSTHTPSPL